MGRRNGRCTASRSQGRHRTSNSRGIPARPKTGRVTSAPSLPVFRGKGPTRLASADASGSALLPASPSSRSRPPAARSSGRDGRCPSSPATSTCCCCSSSNARWPCTGRKSSIACGRTWWSPTALSPRRSGPSGARSARTASAPSSGRSRGTDTSSCARSPRKRTRVSCRSPRGAGRRSNPHRRTRKPTRSPWRSRDSSIPLWTRMRNARPPRNCTHSIRPKRCAASAVPPATRGRGPTCGTAGGTSRARGACRSSRLRPAPRRGWLWPASA